MYQDSEPVEELSNTAETEIGRLRRAAEKNKEELDGRSAWKIHSKVPQTISKDSDPGGGFYFRTALCLLMFCGFLWIQKEGRSILGMEPEALQEAVSQRVVLPDWKESGKINFTIP